MRINYLYPLYHLRPNNLLPLYHLGIRVINKLLSLPSDIAAKIHSTDWVEQSILLPQYQQYLTHYQNHLPKLDTSDLTIAEQIEQEGVSITSLEALAIPQTELLLEAAQQIMTELAQRSRSPSHAHKHTLMATANQLMAHPEIFFWGLSERILKIVEYYLGLPVAYDGLAFYYSVADGRNAGPRIWHRDKEDWKMVKVAVYLNDVDELGGPFQSVKSTVNTWLIETLPKYRGLTHTELQQLFDADSGKADSCHWLNSCVGKAGTVIFTDTARFYHRGKPPIKTDRSAIFFHYFSQRPKNPFFCERSLLSRKQTADLTNQLPPNLQNHLLWRNCYPGIGRYIPKNYMRVDNW
ncbi:hypothetical protein C7293_02675 [filamentous cyanobacterium CCT1]|nr:hypothetical protein C7293_02675 [filamentous cyanobacterium CCT1]PSN81600.1 hypothetical protein C8B47_00345 [filamentous cyanobacterium CCP4]